MLKTSFEKIKGVLVLFVLLDLYIMVTLKWNLPIEIEEHAIPLHCDKLDPVKGGAKKTTFLQERQKNVKVNKC